MKSREHEWRLPRTHTTFWPRKATYFYHSHGASCLALCSVPVDCSSRLLAKACGGGRHNTETSCNSKIVGRRDCSQSSDQSLVYAFRKLSAVFPMGHISITYQKKNSIVPIFVTISHWMKIWIFLKSFICYCRLSSLMHRDKLLTFKSWLLKRAEIDRFLTSWIVWDFDHACDQNGGSLPKFFCMFMVKLDQMKRLLYSFTVCLIPSMSSIQGKRITGNPEQAVRSWLLLSQSRRGICFNPVCALRHPHNQKIYG